MRKQFTLCKPLSFFVLIFMFINLSVKSQGNNANAEAKDIKGYSFLNKIVGQWNGKVTSSTSAGSFDKWYIDFRPVLPSQVSQYSMLDSNTVNITSFFVVKYNNQLKVAMRTEGCFQKKCCVTYEIMDSVSEATGYYRFADFVSGTSRAYTCFSFKEDSYTMEVYTNKFNTLKTLQLHSRFDAKLTGRKAAKEAIDFFKFPQPLMVKDFSGVFKNMKESLYFDLENDPYNTASQPYVGNITVNISFDNNLKVKKTDEICLLLTTEPLFEGIKYKEENLNYLSKYIYLPIETKSYTIKNVHPGKYYLYSYNDINNDKKHTKGDYMSSLVNSFVLPGNGKISVDTRIDFIIP